MLGPKKLFRCTNGRVPYCTKDSKLFTVYAVGWLPSLELDWRGREGRGKKFFWLRLSEGLYVVSQCTKEEEGFPPFFFYLWVYFFAPIRYRTKIGERRFVSTNFFSFPPFFYELGKTEEGCWFVGCAITKSPLHFRPNIGSELAAPPSGHNRPRKTGNKYWN